MPLRRRGHGLEFGLILLLNEMLRFGMRNIPPLTLILILGQSFLYMGMICVPWEKEEVCISGESVILDGDWKRLLLAAFEHGDDMHLYYNMVSFLIKGRTLERKYGSKNFGFILLFLTLVTNVMYIILSTILSAVLNSDAYMRSCAIGFSGVIFALKVLITYEEPTQKEALIGFKISGKYVTWIELILIHLLVPNSLFTGHLAGVLAGLIYCNTWLGRHYDLILSCMTGNLVVHRGEIINIKPTSK